jgi:hypothetical protein
MSVYTLPSYFTSAFAAIFVCLAIRVLLRTTRTKPRYPPGPKPLPLLGNVVRPFLFYSPSRLMNVPSQLDIPLKDEWLTWQSYVHRYGDLVFLSALGRKFLLLGSHEAITDLIDKRVTFNSRPRFPMLHELYVSPPECPV